MILGRVECAMEGPVSQCDAMSRNTNQAHDHVKSGSTCHRPVPLPAAGPLLWPAAGAGTMACRRPMADDLCMCTTVAAHCAVMLPAASKHVWDLLRRYPPYNSTQHSPMPPLGLCSVGQRCTVCNAVLCCGSTPLGGLLRYGMPFQHWVR